MDLPKDLRHLFLEWMQAEHLRHCQNNSRMAHTYTNAMKSLRQCSTMVEHPQQLISLKYIGEKIVALMEKKLSEYCEDMGYEYPQLPESILEKQREKEQKEREKAEKAAKKKRKVNEAGSDDTDCGGSHDDGVGNDKRRRKKTTKRYIPAMNSGGYAIMLALYYHDKRGTGLTKNDIIKFASPLCSSSFTPSPNVGNFYTAFSSMKTLINREYVSVEGSPKHYYLTDEGKEVAESLSRISDAAPISSRTNDQNSSSFLDPNESNISLPRSSAINRSFSEPTNSNRINPLASSSPQVHKTQKITTSSPFHGNSLSDLSRNRRGLPDSTTTTTTQQNSNDTPAKCKSAYQLWKKGSYKIKFILDNREVFSKTERDYFARRLRGLGINLEVRALPVGDGMWVAVNKRTKQESTLDFIFERKRLDDLVGSITDGRYREQKQRLEKTGMKRVFYIVEEAVASDISKFADAIKTTISMNTTYSGFHTKITKNAEETLKLIVDLTNRITRIHRNKTLLVLEPRDINTQGEYQKLLDAVRMDYGDEEKEVVYSYSSFTEIMGKSAMTNVKEMFVRLLMCTKGVGLDKASAIQQHFKIPRNLIESFQRAHPMERCPILIKEALRDEIGPRKVGKALSEKLATIWCSQCVGKSIQE